MEIAKRTMKQRIARAKQHQEYLVAQLEERRKAMLHDCGHQGKEGTLKALEDELGHVRHLEGEELLDELLPEPKWLPDWDTPAMTWRDVVRTLSMLVTPDELPEKTIKETRGLDYKARVFFFYDGTFYIATNEMHEQQQVNAGTLLAYGLIDEATATEIERECAAAYRDKCVRQEMRSALWEELEALADHLADLQDEAAQTELDIYALSKMKPAGLEKAKQKAKDLVALIKVCEKRRKTLSKERVALEKPFWAV